VRARIDAAQRGDYSTEFDVATYFLHDVPETVLRGGPTRQREEAQIVFDEPCRFPGWPRIPVHVVSSEHDRFFPLEFQRGVAKDRLKKEIEVLSGGHLVALSNPEGLSRLLLRFAGELRSRAKA